MSEQIPDLEWSGVLFYTFEGSLKDDSLKIIAKDVLLMNIDTSTFTSFDMNNNDIIGYIVDEDLIGCNTGLIHSHDKMNAFFSGTDTNTLQQEGSERNHFVSLVVNNAGQYVARITTKIVKNATGKLTLKAKTFNNEQVDLPGEQAINQVKEVIVYQDCTITIEESSSSEVNDSFKERYKEIKAKHDEEITRHQTLGNTQWPWNNGIGTYAPKQDDSAYTPWWARKSNEPKNNTQLAEDESQVLDEDVMEELFSNFDGLLTPDELAMDYSLENPNDERDFTWKECIETTTQQEWEHMTIFQTLNDEAEIKMNIFLALVRTIDNCLILETYTADDIVAQIEYVFKDVVLCKETRLIKEVIDEIKTTFRRLKWKSTLF